MSLALVLAHGLLKRQVEDLGGQFILQETKSQSQDRLPSSFLLQLVDEAGLLSRSQVIAGGT